MKWLLCACLLTATTAFAAQTKVLALAGSSRADSYNKQLLQEAVTIARQMGAQVTVIDLKDYPMPFYNADLETSKGLPENAKRLRKLMMQSDVIIIASPEYNSSIPGELKNALDWASRDEKGQFSKEAFQDKRFAIMSASPGKLGGARALVHLRSVIQAAGGTVIEQQVSIGSAHDYFGKTARPENPELKSEIDALLHPQAVPSKT